MRPSLHNTKGSRFSIPGRSVFAQKRRPSVSSPRVASNFLCPWRIYTCPKFEVHTQFAHMQFNNGANSALHGQVAKLAIRRPALSPKRRFYSQMATGREITDNVIRCSQCAQIHTRNSNSLLRSPNMCCVLVVASFIDSP